MFFGFGFINACWPGGMASVRLTVINETKRNEITHLQGVSNETKTLKKNCINIFFSYGNCPKRIVNWQLFGEGQFW